MQRSSPEPLRHLLDLQDGVVSRPQAYRGGLSEAAVDNLVRSGRWRQLGWGVYAAFTGVPSRGALLWAAVLRAGDGAVLSHHSAAEAFRIGPATELIHVTVDARRRVRPVPGLVIHRSRVLDRTRHPAALPPRTRVEDTVLDLAEAARSFDEALHWLSLGCGSRLTTAGRIRSAAAARPRLSGRAELMAALGETARGAHSVLEYRYLRDVERKHGLPRAERQVRFAADGRSQYRDALYRAWRLCVELDGRAAHPDELRWTDRRRDNQAAAVGLITLRYGWADVRDRPCQTAAEVGAVLRQRGWPGFPRPCGPACPAGPTPSSWAISRANRGK